MSPREYLKRTSSPDFEADRYWDNETQKGEHISKLTGHIKDPNKEVRIPYVDKIDHEGRHRAYAAELGNEPDIPVKLPPPKEWRTDKIVNKWVTRTNRDERDKERWKNRIQNNDFPEQKMDLEDQKTYAKILKEEGLIEKESKPQEIKLVVETKEKEPEHKEKPKVDNLKSFNGNKKDDD
jgi:hypothetical protein